MTARKEVRVFLVAPARSGLDSSAATIISAAQSIGTPKTSARSGFTRAAMARVKRL